ncbi:hypothetical protein KP509_04G097200 [Ceratopteris richardii]|uniref:BHLH domain-containing protein n=1 Tax=Ceratopteris richardii TaxID=49495 RepID=A0A8T2UYC0_CERRI|nr:hypothetical protein KP509_04G097200 [Ceratopteris richardii]
MEHNDGIDDLLANPASPLEENRTYVSSSLAVGLRGNLDSAARSCSPVFAEAEGSATRSSSLGIFLPNVPDAERDMSSMPIQHNCYIVQVADPSIASIPPAEEVVGNLSLLQHIPDSSVLSETWRATPMETQDTVHTLQNSFDAPESGSGITSSAIGQTLSEDACARLYTPREMKYLAAAVPQSGWTSARERRRRIREKLQTLRQLVPGGLTMDTASMLDEAARYIAFLKDEVDALRLGNSRLYLLPHLIVRRNNRHVRSIPH